MPTSAAARALPVRRVGTTLGSLVTDLACVGVFALIGRAAHDEGLSLGGWFETAWPFLAGLGVGWLVVLLMRDRPAPWLVRPGVVVWLATVIVGMLLRVVIDAGTATSFIVVALVFNGLLLVGWRVFIQLSQFFSRWADRMGTERARRDRAAQRRAAVRGRR